VHQGSLIQIAFLLNVLILVLTGDHQDSDLIIEFEPPFLVLMFNL
jgi:hypothetical protein